MTLIRAVLIQLEGKKPEWKVSRKGMLRNSTLIWKSATHSWKGMDGDVVVVHENREVNRWILWVVLEDSRLGGEEYMRKENRNKELLSCNILQGI